MVPSAGRVDRYLHALDEMAGGVEPIFRPMATSTDRWPRLTAIYYSDLPERGTSLGLTYGLSLGEHERWQHGKPELCICVAANDPLWVMAVTHLAQQLRGDCPFEYGDTINFGGPIAPTSSMDGFVVSVPLVVEARDAHIDVGDDHPVHLQGVYPTYASERRFVQEHGLDPLMRLDWDPYDVTRPPVA